MMSFQDIRGLLQDLPGHAKLRIAVNGREIYAQSQGLELTEVIQGDWVQLQGMIGDTASSLKQGAAIICVDRVDFIHVLA